MVSPVTMLEPVTVNTLVRASYVALVSVGNATFTAIVFAEAVVPSKALTEKAVIGSVASAGGVQTNDSPTLNNVEPVVTALPFLVKMPALPTDSIRKLIVLPSISASFAAACKSAYEIVIDAAPALETGTANVLIRVKVGASFTAATVTMA